MDIEAQLHECIHKDGLSDGSCLSAAFHLMKDTVRPDEDAPRLRLWKSQLCEAIIDQSPLTTTQSQEAGLALQCLNELIGMCEGRPDPGTGLLLEEYQRRIDEIRAERKRRFPHFYVHI